MNVFEVFDIAIGIEKRLSNMYYKFSSLFKDSTEIHNFWSGIANHEKSHSETLTFGKGYLQWNHPSLQHKQIPIVHFSDIKELKSLDSITGEYEKKTRKKRVSLQDALGILLIIENSELNHIFNRLVHISGFKPAQKPENVHKTIYEHMKVIKAFVDKYYRGVIPSIKVEDYRETRHLPASANVEAVSEKIVETVPGKIAKVVSEKITGVVSGKIAEIELHMSYGFIEGTDGKRYMFLPEDLSGSKWEELKVNCHADFSVMNLPWGPRAKEIHIRS